MSTYPCTLSAEHPPWKSADTSKHAIQTIRDIPDPETPIRQRAHLENATTTIPARGMEYPLAHRPRHDRPGTTPPPLPYTEPPPRHPTRPASTPPARRFGPTGGWWGNLVEHRESGSHGLWRSLVAHLTGGQVVAGSNPVSPTYIRRWARFYRTACCLVRSLAHASGQALGGSTLLLVVVEVKSTTAKSEWADAAQTLSQPQAPASPQPARQENMAAASGVTAPVLRTVSCHAAMCASPQHRHAVFDVTAKMTAAQGISSKHLLSRYSGTAIMQSRGTTVGLCAPCDHDRSAHSSAKCVAGYRIHTALDWRW